MELEFSKLKTGNFSMDLLVFFRSIFVRDENHFRYFRVKVDVFLSQIGPTSLFKPFHKVFYVSM